jgi:hypothetical protein
VLKFLELEDKLEMAECLDERNDGQIAQPRPPHDRLHVLLRVAVSGGNVPGVDLMITIFGDF